MIPPPPLVLSFAQAHLCDNPFCNISRDNCAIPHENKPRKHFAMLSLQVLRDMKSIAAGPLRSKRPSFNFKLAQNVDPRFAAGLPFRGVPNPGI